MPRFSIGARVVTVMLLAYTTWFGTVCVVKYRYYLYKDQDFAIFAQAMEQMLRGSFDSSIRGIPWLGDHSSLILLPLLPIYAIFRHPATLLVLKSLALGLGAWPIFLIARRELRDEPAAVACSALYLMHPALGYLNLFEFHPESLAVPALLFTIWFCLEERTWAACVTAGLALLCREDAPLVVIPVALWLLIRRRRRALIPAGLLAGLSLLSLALTFAVLKPAMSHTPAGAEIAVFPGNLGAMYGTWGSRPIEMVVHLLKHPLQALAALGFTSGDPVDSTQKLHAHVYMLAPWMFLPLASPLTLLIALPILLLHFLSNAVAQHSILYEYMAYVLPLWGVAAIEGMRRLARLPAGPPGPSAEATSIPTSRLRSALASPREGSRRTIRLRWIAAAAVAASIVCNLLYGPFAGRAGWADAVPPQLHRPDGVERALKPYRDRMLARIPKDAGVVAGFEFLSHLAARGNLHSAHHVFRGTYTYSSVPYPTPTGVAGVLLDAGHEPLIGFVGRLTGQRMRETLALNHLAPVDAVGDLVLYLREPRAPLLMVVPDRSTPAAPARVTFDGTLVYLGHDLLPPTARPGGLLEVRTRWQKLRSSRLYAAGWELLNEKGQARVRQLHPLGYVDWMANAWPIEVPLAERYRLVIPEDLPPGFYRVALRLFWADDHGSIAETDDPDVRARNGALDLGSIEIRP